GQKSPCGAALRGSQGDPPMARRTSFKGHEKEAAGFDSRNIKEKAMKVTVDMVEKEHLRTNLPTFRVGDQIRVTLKIVEGDNERLQAFEGTVIRISGHGLSRM